MVYFNGLYCLFKIQDRTDIKGKDANGKTAENPDKISPDGKHGHHNNKSAHTGQYQKIKGIQPHGLQGVNFFIYLHGAQLGSVGSTRSSGHDDCGHHGPHFPNHGQPHKIGNKDICSEHL